MKEFAFEATINSSGTCTVVVKADTAEEAIAKVRGGSWDDVVDAEWDVGDVDVESIRELE